jgi:hypothetical protein
MAEAEDSSQLNEVQASEILKIIEDGDLVIFNRVIIKGDLNLSELNLPTKHIERSSYEVEVLCLSEEAKLVKSTIRITDSKIEGNLTFDNCIFQEPVNFEETKFSGYASFREAQFIGDAYFENAHFSENARFKQTHFKGDADFRGTQFNADVDFGNVQFSENARFTQAQFARYADFGGAQFSLYAGFREAQFNGDAYFENAQFSENARFTQAQFVRYADFGGAQFSGYASFRGVLFNDNAKFKQALFSENANFESVRFNIKLDMTRSNFNRLYIGWDSIKDHLDFDGATYLALIKNFKNLEQFGDADDCYYQYRKISQENKEWYVPDNWIIKMLTSIYNWAIRPLNCIIDQLYWINRIPPFLWIHRFNWSKLIDYMGWVSCGYGVKVWPIIFWIAGSIFGFAFLYRIFDGIGKVGPSEIVMESVNNGSMNFTLIPGNVIVPPSWSECLYFSAMSLTRRGPENLHPLGAWKYAVMIESVLGYLFLALFVVVLARKVIR